MDDEEIGDKIDELAKLGKVGLCCLIFQKVLDR